MRRIIIGASRDIEYDLRNDFFARLQRLPLGYFQAHRTGDLMSRATNDLNAVRMMIGPAVMYSANTVLMFVVAILLMLSIDPRLTLIALIPLPLVSVSVQLLRQRHPRALRAHPGAVLGDQRGVQEALSGVRVVRAYGQEAAEIERFRRANRICRPQPGADPAAGLFYPSMTLFSASARCWSSGSAAARSSRPHDAWRVRRVQRLPGDAQLADDRLRLGHQHPAARHGVVEADARGARQPSLPSATQP